MQKKTYLLQQFDLDLGYRFQWYKYGPYNQRLADEVFNMGWNLQADILKNYKLSDSARKKVDDFVSFIGQVENVEPKEKVWEAVASIHFLKYFAYTNKEVNENNIRKTLRSLGKDFDNDLVDQAWKLIENSKYLNQ